MAEKIRRTDVHILEKKIRDKNAENARLQPKADEKRMQNNSVVIRACQRLIDSSNKNAIH